MDQNQLEVAEDNGGFSLYMDVDKVLRALNKRLMYVMLPYSALLFVVFHFLRSELPRDSGVFLYWEFTWLPWFGVAFFLFTYVASFVATRRQSSPVIRLSADGIAIDMPGMRLGHLDWREIGDIKVTKFTQAFVGITPTDIGALCRRLGGRRAWLLRINGYAVPVNRLMGIQVAAIVIPQLYLPIPAEELVQRIDSYRAKIGVASWQQERPVSASADAWPPPPTFK